MTTTSTKSKNDKCHEELDWPAFDTDFLNELREKSLVAPRPVQKDTTGWMFSVVQTPWSLREWAIDNLPIKLTDEWVVAFQRFQESLHVAPHRDAIRKFSYNCLLTEGGPTTQFYTNKGQLFDSVVYGKNKWYFHNSSVPHGVENSDKSGENIIRTAVTVFKVDPTQYSRAVPISLKGPAPTKVTPEVFLKAFRKDPFFYYAQN